MTATSDLLRSWGCLHQSMVCELSDEHTATLITAARLPATACWVQFQPVSCWDWGPTRAGALRCGQLNHVHH